MAGQQIILTPEGLNKAQKELEELWGVRTEITHRIEEAIKMGDLSENAEYHEAKDAQNFNEQRISELDYLVKYAVVSEESQGGSIIVMGSKIKVEDNAGKTIDYSIVGMNEADPAAGFISNESPLGRAFLGHKKGDEIEITLPRGVVTYKILAVK